MGRGLPRRQFLIFDGGGINTKTDPRLVPAGELVEIENMDYQRTGELRLRNGFAVTSLSALNGTTRLTSAFRGPGGSLGVIGGASAVSDRMFFVEQPVTGTAQPTTGDSLTWFPGLTPVVTPVGAMPRGTTVTAVDHVDPDCAVVGSFVMDCWTERGGAGNVLFTVKDLNGVQLNSTIGPYTQPGWTIPAAARGRCAAGGTTYLTFFAIDNAGVPSLRAYTVNALTGALVSSNQLVSTINDVAAAQPWFAVKAIPGSSNIIVAYRATGGGVTCLEFNPATGATVTGPVNTAGADASMCLDWLDDTLATGSYYLATAGAGPGAVVRTMSAALAVTATLVIDATATANVNGITGYIRTSATNYNVMWDLTSAPPYNTRIVLFTVQAGAVFAATGVRSVGLLSRAFKLGEDYHVLAAYESTTQSTTFLLRNPANSISAMTSVSGLLGGIGGKRLVRNSCLTSVIALGATMLAAIARQTRTVAANGTFTTSRGIVNAQWSVAPAPERPQELGGVLFVAGGHLTQVASGVQTMATHPVTLEPPACVGAIIGGGAMTAAGVYQYVTVPVFVDPQGRVCRGAPSTPTSVTLGGADNGCNLTIPTERVVPGTLNQLNTGLRLLTIEAYRAGPAAAGNTTFNQVGSVGNGDPSAVDTVAFADTMSDANAVAGELLYTTGNILENLPPPPCRLLTTCGNRVWVVNSETPTELWPSKEFKAGAGIGFNDRIKVRVDGDGYGEITALVSMDGRVVAFKSTAIYVISGDGPNDTGQGAFNPPQAVSLSVGTVLPGSAVATPDGIMFQAAQGIYLLDRGLGLTYIGKNVEQYTLAANVVDGSLVTGTTKARFVMASGRCLTWDFHHKRWTTSQLRVSGSAVVACADLPTGWVYALANGKVFQETPGVYSDVDGSSTAIVPRIGLPALSLAGINGFARVYGIDVLGEYVGDHTLAVDFEYDFGGAVTETRTKAITAGAFQYEVKVAQQKITSIKITLRTSVQAAGSGAFRLSGLTLWAGMKQGSGLPYTKRLS